MIRPHSKPLAVLLTATGSHHLSLRVAGEFFGRLRGLMLAPALPPDHGLLLTCCSSVHTCFMRDDVDVVYLDARGVVTKCVSQLKPWRASTARLKQSSHMQRPAGKHVLELAAGTIARLKIAQGSRLLHDIFVQQAPGATLGGVWRERRTYRQRGSAMLEFTVVAPIITLLGLACIQYGMLFFAKNQYNHAAFMAARAGSIRNASLDEIRDAYERALIPLYGGGTNAVELDQALTRAKLAVEANTDIVMLNPTSESFRDWNDPDLQKKFKTAAGQHVIPNGGLAFKKAAIVPAASGQSIQDANVLKLRITHGYKPQVPVVGAMYARYLKWLDTGADPRATEKINMGLIPVVMQITMQMQSDAIEGVTVSAPGMGNGGTASDPGNPPLVRTAPPSCKGALCREAPAGGASGGGDTGSGTTGSGTTGDGADTGIGDTGTQPGGICMEPARA